MYFAFGFSNVRAMRDQGLKIRLFASFTVVLLLGACGISKEVYHGDVNRLRGQIKSLESKNQGLFKDNGARAAAVSKLEQDMAACTNKVAALQGQGAQLSAELQAKLTRIRELEAVAARQKAVFDQLTKALDALVKSGKLTVSIVRGQFTVQMSEKILFDSGRYAIKPEAEETLTDLTNILRSVANRRFQVVGHTDTDGSADFNWKLSSNRSRAVTTYMIEQGMPPERLTFAGAGEYQPNVPNDSPEQKAQNRRIEIVLVPDLEELLAPLRDK